MMVNALSDDRIPVVYEPRFREYGVLVDRGPAFQLLFYCPWDGAELPPSLRDEFFDIIHERGLELESDELPSEFRSDEWWQDRHSG
jgi:hypothetical protein